MDTRSNRKMQSKLEDYDIVIECGNKPKGACQAIIHVTLYGDKNMKGEEEELAIVQFPENMKRGYQHTFTVKEITMDTVVGVAVRGDTMVGNSGWNIDKILVIRKKTEVKTVIPVFTTIKCGRIYIFKINDTSLPLPGTSNTPREHDLKEKQSEYVLTDERLPGGPPLLKDLPNLEEYFGVNTEHTKGIVHTARPAQDECEKYLKEKKHGYEEFESFSDIEKLYDELSFPKPSNLNRWKDDKLFGMQRLMGVNPDVIQLCTEFPVKLNIKPKDLEKYLENKKFNEALDSRRIFIVDYKILEGLPTTKGYILPVPIALFYQRDDGMLVPIAIQLTQKPGSSVFLPTDPENTWVLAKMWFNVADANYHESITHLGFTHLKMEGIVVCTHRQLHQKHPLYKLLMNHFNYLLNINWKGMPILLDGADCYGEKVLTLGSKGMKALIVKMNNKWKMDVEGTFPTALEFRGVKNSDLLPHYYYREDGLKLYHAINSYVKNYINLYYKSDDTVKEDREIQNWRKEITAPVADQGLGMQGVFGENNRFTTKEQVWLTLTSIIFTCSAKHAAVNFRQYEEYAYPPNQPGSLRGSLPSNNLEFGDEQLLHALPNIRTTLDMMTITSILSMRDMKKLGDFEVEYITDSKAVEVVEEFRKDLEIIAAENKIANATRLEPYNCLSPSLVPNSISI